MISLRKKPSAPDTPPAAPPSHPGDAKGRPTPKRREAEAAKKRPLVPADRKQAARQDREKQRQARAHAQRAMAAGDERYLPARDKGPIRRYVRDYIDARRNVGEIFLPVSLVALLFVVFLGGNENLVKFALVGFLALYAVIIASVIDVLIATQRLKRRLIATFGTVPRGTLFYAAMRAYQLRSTRVPRPQVKRGEYPS